MVVKPRVSAFQNCAQRYLRHNIVRDIALATKLVILWTGISVNTSIPVKLKYKRGGKNTHDLSGMHMMAHVVQEFYNTAWDRLHVELEYMWKQRYPSPAYMPDYPKYDDQPPGEFYLGHKDIACASSPCFDGA